MSNIAELIKELRSKSGAGFLDCKNALAENSNDIEKSVEYLRKKGLAKASKKTSRDANEGAVGIYSNENITVVIKVNSETDFAAKSDTFLDFLDNLGQIALDTNQPKLSRDKFLNLNTKEGLVSDYFNNMIAKIGENLVLKDLLILPNEGFDFAYYIHNSYRNNIGKIISIIKYNSDKKDNVIENLSKNLCMHIAAMKPESLDIEDLDEKIINNEKNIQRELILNSGKPSNIVEKILEGKMKKFYSEVTLNNQNFIMDQELTIKEVINKHSNIYNYKLISFHLINL